MSAPEDLSNSAQSKSQLAKTTIVALGVIYGDIGTSPLYALRECFHGPHSVSISEANILGVLSLILWSLILVISVKYCLFVLRADNKGEGGILALLTQAAPKVKTSGKRSFGPLIAIGLFGAALLYSDGVITPAISVLSAVEGLKVATPHFEPYILLITAAILIGLFFIQKHGTARIGKTFGPIMLVWFATLGGLGLRSILKNPEVLRASNPLYAVEFFALNSWHGFVVLGSVFLVVTGGETIYADLGHFGRRIVRLGWFGVAFPCLVLQYFGQGALLLRSPEAAWNPFYLLAPGWGLYPLVALATVATVIAAQAVITGAFSLSQQAVQLGYLPRIEVRHTSEQAIGQIYVPFVNWALLICTLFLVFEFRSSSKLAAAYGIAVTSTMAITTILAYVVMRRKWRWSRLIAAPLSLAFLVIDLSFLGSNTIKILDGGWFPLALALIIFLVMKTWKDGRRILSERLAARSIPLNQFIGQYLPTIAARPKGAAVFMSAAPGGTPPALMHNTLHNQVVHQRVIILTIQTTESPHVANSDRIVLQDHGHGFYSVVARYGFMEAPNVPRVLTLCAPMGLDIDIKNTTFFLGRESLVATKNRGMAVWRERLFALMTRNAQRAAVYFQIPAEQAIEVGAVIEL